MCPVVLDVMNLVANFHRWWTALGAWSFAIRDYWEMNFTARLDDPQTAQMFAIVDPFAYIDR